MESNTLKNPEHPNSLGRVWQYDVIDPNQLGRVWQVNEIDRNQLGHSMAGWRDWP